RSRWSRGPSRSTGWMPSGRPSRPPASASGGRRRFSDGRRRVLPSPRGRSMEESDGREGRFRTLFEAELDYVFATLRRLGVAPRDLEDVTHEVFLRVHARWDEYDPARPVRPWIFAFAFRLASDYRRLARH